MCQSLFLNKAASMRPATLLKKRLWHRCIPVNFAKFLRTPILQNTSSGCFRNSVMDYLKDQANGQRATVYQIFWKNQGRFL